jgi:hypothetical protein
MLLPLQPRVQQKLHPSQSTLYHPNHSQCNHPQRSEQALHPCYPSTEVETRSDVGEPQTVKYEVSQAGDGSLEHGLAIKSLNMPMQQLLLLLRIKMVIQTKLRPQKAAVRYLRRYLEKGLANLRWPVPCRAYQLRLHEQGPSLQIITL